MARQEPRAHGVLDEGDGGEATTEGLDRQRQVEDTGTAAAVGLGNTHPGRTHRTELLPQVVREAEGLVGPQLVDRADPVHQRAEHVDDGLLFVGGVEIHGHI
jgi:hypothetical protein